MYQQCESRKRHCDVKIIGEAVETTLVSPKNQEKRATKAIQFYIYVCVCMCVYDGPASRRLARSRPEGCSRPSSSTSRVLFNPPPPNPVAWPVSQYLKPRATRVTLIVQKRNIIYT